MTPMQLWWLIDSRLVGMRRKSYEDCAMLGFVSLLNTQNNTVEYLNTIIIIILSANLISAAFFYSCYMRRL